MSYFDISINDLANSDTIATAIAGNAVPKNGINILSTSAAARGYADQTLSSSDLVSASSGKDLLAGGVYGNMYRINMMRESLSSLSSTILGSEDANLQIGSSSELDSSGNPVMLTRRQCRTVDNRKWPFGQKLQRRGAIRF